jgi:hypothetical protein
MIESAAQLYTLLFWPMIMIGALLSAWRADAALFRCVAVLFIGQSVMDIYSMFVDYSSQPWLLLLAINAWSVHTLTIKPTGLIINTMAWLFLIGVMLSVIQGVFWFTFSDELYIAVDMIMWQYGVFIASLTLLVLLGGAIGDGGKRLIRNIWSGASYVAHAAFHRGAA